MTRVDCLLRQPRRRGNAHLHRRLTFLLLLLTGSSGSSPSLSPPSVFFVLSCEAADYLSAIAALRAASIQAFISVLCPRFDETQETNERSKLIARAAGWKQKVANLAEIWFRLL